MKNQLKDIENIWESLEATEGTPMLNKAKKYSEGLYGKFKYVCSYLCHPAVGLIIFLVVVCLIIFLWSVK